VAAPKVQVGVVLPTRDEPRWAQDESRFASAMASAGLAGSVLYSDGDPSTEAARVDALVAQGMKVLVIVPVDETASAAAADRARRAGVKVICIDRLIRGTASVDWFVTFDRAAVGEAWGRYLADRAKGRGNALYLFAGPAAEEDTYLYLRGAWKVLQPRIADGTFVVRNSTEAATLASTADPTRAQLSRIVGQVTTGGIPAAAKALAQAALAAGKAAEKAAVFACAPDDASARAIVEAFAADRAVKKYVVTGLGAEEPSIQSIIDGRQSMTVLQDERILVADALAAAAAFLRGAAPPPESTWDNGAVTVPGKASALVTVTRDNVKAEIMDTRYWPAEDFRGL
jgi:putative multiple sugar transport system substrate-binding protein